MPSNTPEYIAKNKLYLNKRSLLCYHNRTAKLSYDEIHAYEAEHGIDKTLLFLKTESLRKKYESVLN